MFTDYNIRTQILFPTIPCGYAMPSKRGNVNKRKWTSEKSFNTPAKPKWHCNKAYGYMAFHWQKASKPNHKKAQTNLYLSISHPYKTRKDQKDPKLL